MKRVILKIGIGFYIVVTLFVTICLLAYNDYKVSEFGDTSLFVLKEDLGGFNKNDLLIVSKKDIGNIKQNTEVLYYDSYDSKVKIDIEKVTKVDKISDKEYTLNFDDGSYISNDFIIGSVDSTVNLGFLGLFLKVLESKIGYLLIIVLPMFLVFLYELVAVVKEIKVKR